MRKLCRLGGDREGRMSCILLYGGVCGMARRSGCMHHWAGEMGRGDVQDLFGRKSEDGGERQGLCIAIHFVYSWVDMYSNKQLVAV